jgi:hypothetical protein
MKSLKNSTRRTTQSVLAGVAAGLFMLWGGAAHAYPASTHQSFTFLAAKLFNQCAETSGDTPLTAMQVRYLARATVNMADRSVFLRMFRWNYYAPQGYSGRVLGGLVDTRFNGHYESLVEALDETGTDVDRLEAHGAVNFYLHHVTTPQRVVPVYTNRLWRMSFSDRFDDVPPDEARILAALRDPCAVIRDANRDLRGMLHVMAEDTRNRVREVVPGMQVTWQVFWQFAAEDGAFGEYGPAGNNFGREAEFGCGDEDRCVLLDADPLYLDFAAARHAAAVAATLQLLARLGSGVSDGRADVPAETSPDVD